MKNLTLSVSAEVAGYVDRAVAAGDDKSAAADCAVIYEIAAKMEEDDDGYYRVCDNGVIVPDETAFWKYIELPVSRSDAEASVAGIDPLKATDSAEAAEARTDSRTDTRTAEAVNAAAADCYCPTCQRTDCPARDKVQRKALGECARFGGYVQSADPWDLRDVLRRYAAA